MTDNAKPHRLHRLKVMEYLVWVILMLNAIGVFTFVTNVWTLPPRVQALENNVEQSQKESLGFRNQTQVTIQKLTSDSDYIKMQLADLKQTLDRVFLKLDGK